MLRNQLRRAASGRLIFGTPKIGLDAAQIVSETASGDQGPGLIHAKALAYPGRQLRIKITDYTGTPSKLFVFENGSFLITGEPDGLYTINFDWEAWATDGSTVITGSDSSPVRSGPLNASAGGGTGTGTGSGSGGDASGGLSATAPGGTGTGTGSGSGGNATTQQNGNAAGGTGTGTGSGAGGDAVAGTPGSATAPGGIGTGIGSGSGGDATAQANAQAPGGTGTGTGSGSGGIPSDGSAIAFSKTLVVPGRRYLLRVKR